MKVLMIEHFLPDNGYTLELGRELKNCCDLTIFCKKSANAREEGIHWIPEFYPGGKHKLAAVLDYGLSLLKIRRLVKRGHFDVLHVQTFKNAKFEMKLYYGLRRYVKKLVFTVHNVLPHEESPRDRELYREFYEFCDVLIVHNEASKKCLTESFSVPEEKITVIAHGTYKARPLPSKTTEDSAVTHFLQFGFIRKYKGIDILLEAVALIPKEKRAKLRFTIAGKQYQKLDDTDYQAKIEELGIGDCVEFRSGHIPEKELPGLFADTDFMLFPYRDIYGSGALLMAYSYEKPVIASSIPAFCEETDGGRTGVLFESENPEALAGAILKASECKPLQLTEYQKAIHELVTEKYNWKRSAGKTAEVYEK